MTLNIQSMFLFFFLLYIFHGLFSDIYRSWCHAYIGMRMRVCCEADFHLTLFPDICIHDIVFACACVCVCHIHRSVNVSHFPLVDGARLKDILDENDELEAERQRMGAGGVAVGGAGVMAGEGRYYNAAPFAPALFASSRSQTGNIGGSAFVPNLSRRRSSLRADQGSLPTGMHRRLSSLVLNASASIPGFLDSSSTSSSSLSSASSSSSSSSRGTAAQTSSHPRPNATAAFPSASNSNSSSNASANQGSSTQVRADQTWQ